MVVATIAWTQNFFALQTTGVKFVRIGYVFMWSVYELFTTSIHTFYCCDVLVWREWAVVTNKKNRYGEN